MKYFLQKKINDASHKLQYTKTAIEQVANSVGYGLGVESSVKARPMAYSAPMLFFASGFKVQPL